MILPILAEVSEENSYKMVLSQHQNHYPDITYILENGDKIALDIKSSYRQTNDRVNGMTLGAFTGYFRNRDSNKNITYSYDEYCSHFILGIIYSRSDLQKFVFYFKISTR